MSYNLHGHGPRRCLVRMIVMGQRMIPQKSGHSGRRRIFTLGTYREWLRMKR
jgi:hypothetical protein